MVVKVDKILKSEVSSSTLSNISWMDEILLKCFKSKKLKLKEQENAGLSKKIYIFLIPLGKKIPQSFLQSLHAAFWKTLLVAKIARREKSDDLFFGLGNLDMTPIVALLLYKSINFASIIYWKIFLLYCEFLSANIMRRVEKSLWYLYWYVVYVHKISRDSLVFCFITSFLMLQRVVGSFLHEVRILIA